MHLLTEIAQPQAAIALGLAATKRGMVVSMSALSSCKRLKATSALTSVPALLASTPGVSRNNSELKTALRRVMRVDPTEKTPKAHSATARTATAGSGREIEAASEKLINVNVSLR